MTKPQKAGLVALLLMGVFIFGFFIGTSCVSTKQLRYGDYVIIQRGFHQGRRGQVSSIDSRDHNKIEVKFSSGNENANTTTVNFERNNLFILERNVEIEEWSKD